ncbi:MAG TPA: hypothetical protein VFP60_03810 [Pseudolabrys sp.]|nr:hypothetical protein [Pseudolabrys sp.]
MATQTTALAQQPRNASEEEEYRAFLDALSASARGRAFLAEYARRNANSDAGAFFSALENLRNTLGPDSSSQDQLSVKVKLRDLLEEIHRAQSELEARLQALKAEKLSELVALVGRRLAEFVSSMAADSSNLELHSSNASISDQGREGGDDLRAQLAVVPPPEQPELPIPSPSASPLPPIALVHDTSVAHADLIAEITFVNAASEPKPGPAGSGTASSQEDPFASIMALSEEERLALFT